MPPDVLPSLLSVIVADFGRIISAQMTERFQNEQITFPLYQYTSQDGLNGILRSGKMWCTDYRFLNDPSEFDYGMKLVHEALDVLWARKSINTWFVSRVEAMMSREIFDIGFRFYIASFSKARNDLGQWRAYADNGQGCAVGFASEMFGIRHSTPGNPQDDVIFGPVIYDKKSALNRNLLAIELALEHLNEARRLYPDIQRNTRIREFFEHQLAVSLVANPLVWNALTTKHPAYEHEQEMRLVVMGQGRTLEPFIATRARNGVDIPYIESSWDIRRNGRLHEIVVGPTAPQGVEHEIESLLSDLNLIDANVTKSDIPYRAT